MVRKDKKSHLENRWLYKKFGWAAYASLCSAYCIEIIEQFALAHGVSIISGSLSGAQGAFPARQISLYYCRDREVLQQKLILSDGITRIYQIYQAYSTV